MAQGENTGIIGNAELACFPHSPNQDGFAILDTYADSPEHRRYRERHEHHFQGDVPAHGCGELSRWSGTAAGGEGPGAVPWRARFAAGREWPGEMRRLFSVRCKLSGKRSEER